MPGRLFISDANIIIDMKVGGLLRLMFRFDATFAVPDVLFEEELQAEDPELPSLGLKSTICSRSPSLGLTEAMAGFF